MERRPIVPEDRAAFAAESRRSWHRAIAAHALATLRRNDDAATIVKSTWPNDARAQLIVRGASSPTATADYPSFNPVVAFRSLAPGSAALALFERGLALDLTGISTIRIPAVAGLPVQPIFVAEDMAAATLQWTMESTVVGPARKVLIAAVVTRELDEATPATAEAVVARVMADVANKGIDSAAFDSAAADTTRPAGLLNGVTPVTAAAAGPDAMADDLGALTGAIGAAGIDASNAVFVCSPREATILKARVGPRFDFQILMTLGLAPKTIACFAPAAVASGYRDAPQIETSRETALHMEQTAPLPLVDGSGIVAHPQRSMFQTDCLAIKVRGNCAWAVVPGGAQFISAINW
jgi:hypothetical protein